MSNNIKVEGSPDIYDITFKKKKKALKRLIYTANALLCVAEAHWDSKPLG